MKNIKITCAVICVICFFYLILKFASAPVGDGAAKILIQLLIAGMGAIVVLPSKNKVQRC